MMQISGFFVVRRTESINARHTLIKATAEKLAKRFLTQQEHDLFAHIHPPVSRQRRPILPHTGGSQSAESLGIPLRRVCPVILRAVITNVYRLLKIKETHGRADSRRASRLVETLISVLLITSFTGLTAALLP
jgi:hypothetical protein